MATAFLQKYWYWIVIAVLAFVVIVLIVKSRKKPQYHDQIKENKIRFMEENSLNPTPIKYIKRLNEKWRVYSCRLEGRIERIKPEIKERQLKEWDKIEIKNMEFEKLKAQLKGSPLPEIIKYCFSIRRKNLFGILYYGEKIRLDLEPDDFTFKRTDTIDCSQVANIVYFRGVYSPFRIRMLDTIQDDSIRVMRDLETNADGSEMKEFSRIKSEFAHSEVMKEKDIEYEKEKKKSSFSSG